uniref:Probable membrane transporter protein n=1 Tax=Candidatus Kentrum sp. FW TaxID=2126338 RepID=A0A450T711_9GAMM|nr:MAG: Sulfite exporter TauE/SafE [Candidatus Kentron sp. FW]
MDIVSLLLLGIVAGILAGLLGIGGGIVIVPVLVWIFHGNTQIPEAYLMHIALGTSLATIVVTSLSSIRAHHRRGAVQWPVVRQLTPGFVIGVLLGATIADALSSHALQRFFAPCLFSPFRSNSRSTRRCTPIVKCQVARESLWPDR